MKLTIVRDDFLLQEGELYYRRKSRSFMSFVNYLAAYLDEVELLTGFAAASPLALRKEYDVENPVDFAANIRLVYTYCLPHVIDYYRRLPRVISRNFPVFRKALRNTDAVLLTVPSVNSLLAYFSVRRYRLPYFTYMTGNQEAIVKEGTKYRGPAKAAAMGLARFHSLAFKPVIAGADDAFYMGSELKILYPNRRGGGKVTFTSILTEEEIGEPRKAFESVELRLMYLGRLAHEKGVDHLLKAVRMLKDRGELVRLIVCGDGDERPRLEEQARRDGIVDEVEFWGHIPRGLRMEDAFSQSDVFVFPTLSEGVPKVLLEAMARGLPIVTTRVGGIPDVVENGRNGVMIRPGSPEAIVDALLELKANRERMALLSREAIAYAREHTAAKQAEFIALVIRDCVESRSNAGRRKRS